MAGVRGAFENALAQAMEEINRKEERAFQNTIKRMEVELFKVMEKVTVKNFYRGYTPTVYDRTNQLHSAISIRLDDISSSNEFSFDVVPIYDESSMDHSELTLMYQPMKNKKPFGGKKKYTYTLENVDEEEIMELALGEGIHRKVGPARTTSPIWLNDGNDTGILFDSLEDYVNKNASRIFNEEYNKL